MQAPECSAADRGVPEGPAAVDADRVLRRRRRRQHHDRAGEEPLRAADSVRVPEHVQGPALPAQVAHHPSRRQGRQRAAHHGRGRQAG